MSLASANAFYEMLVADGAIYAEYHHQCCRQGFLGSYHWDQTRIVNFAAKLGYSFTEYELKQIWWEFKPNYSGNSLDLAEYGQLS